MMAVMMMAMMVMVGGDDDVDDDMCQESEVNNKGNGSVTLGSSSVPAGCKFCENCDEKGW